MKKTILTLVTLITMATGYQSNAAIGLPVLAVGGTAYIALAGLAIPSFGIASSVGMSYFSDGADGADPTFFIFLGIVLLDGENSQKIEFKVMNEKELSKIGLTENESLAYRNYTDELSEAFYIVSSKLSRESTSEDAKILWQEQENILGVDAINGARKVLTASFKEK